MARKTSEKLTDTLDTLKPYLDRALTDPEFREDLKDALDAARKVYGPLTKGNGGVATSATRLATDKDVQENLRRALEDVSKAAQTLKGKKRGGKGRKALLLAGVVAGALYNPWTGPQTREWLLDRIAGDDELHSVDIPSPDVGETMPAGVGADMGSTSTSEDRPVIS